MIDRFRLATYEELDEANARGLSNETIATRIRRGWTTDDALKTPLNNYLMPKELKDRLSKVGVSPRAYRERLRRGWTKEKASATPILWKQIRTVEEMERINASAIDSRTINGRLRRGWDFERAITEPPMNIGRGANKKDV